MNAMSRIQALGMARLEVIAEELKVALKEELNKSGGGRMYGAHKASAPGEPPAPDTTALRESAKWRRLDPNTVRVSVGTTYAAALEYGTRTMAPRPFFRSVIARRTHGRTNS